VFSIINRINESTTRIPQVPKVRAWNIHPFMLFDIRIAARYASEKEGSRPVYPKKTYIGTPRVGMVWKNTCQM
jgi:hypothetical protein